MTRWSRRRTLHCCAGLFAVAAGCADVSPDDSGPTTTPVAGVDDYETYSLRSDDPIVAETDDGGDDRGSVSALLRSPDDEAVRFVTEPDGTDDARAFVADTRFDDESLFVVQTAVGECYRHEVAAVRRSDDSLSVHFCEAVRDADVACDEGERQFQATFVRLPFAVETDRAGYSIAVGGNCPAARRTGGVKP